MKYIMIEEFSAKAKLRVFTSVVAKTVNLPEEDNLKIRGSDQVGNFSSYRHMAGCSETFWKYCDTIIS